MRKTSAVLPGERWSPASEYRYPEALRWSQNRRVVQFLGCLGSPRSRNQRIARRHPTGVIYRARRGNRTVESRLRVDVDRIGTRRVTDCCQSLCFGRFTYSEFLDMSLPGRIDMSRRTTDLGLLVDPR